LDIKLTESENWYKGKKYFWPTKSERGHKNESKVGHYLENSFELDIVIFSDMSVLEESPKT
jgi:hypothetical protein